MNSKLKAFMKDNRGVGVVELILILVVLIAIVLLFKGELTTLVEDAFSTITDNADQILG